MIGRLRGSRPGGPATAPVPSAAPVSSSAPGPWAPGLTSAGPVPAAERVSAPELIGVAAESVGAAATGPAVEWIPAAGSDPPGRPSSDQQAPEAAPAAVGRRRPDPWRAAFFGILVLAILAGAAWALLGSSLLVVRHEEVTGNRLVPDSQVLAAAGIRPGTPLASLNLQAAAHRVERIDQVLSATVSRSWPDSIVISVRERTPVLAVASAGRFALVDPSGVVVRWSSSRPAGMPLLDAPSAQLRGSPGVHAAATVLRQLPARLRGLLESIRAPSAQAVTLHLRGGITVLWGDTGQAQAKAQEVIALLRTRARYYDVSDPTTVVTQG